MTHTLHVVHKGHPPSFPVTHSRRFSEGSLMQGERGKLHKGEKMFFSLVVRMYITFSKRERRKGKLFLHLKNETILPNYFYWKPHRACSQDGTVQGGDIVRAVWRRGIVKVLNAKEEEGERKCNKFIFGKKEAEEG